MKSKFLLLSIFLILLISACKPDFDLNASYKNVTVVYGLLDANADTNYVKIYRGFQSRDGNTFLNAQNPDSIYYYDKIRVVLEEYINNVRTDRDDILLNYTNDFPRDAGVFYYENERIIYFTDEKLSKDAHYKIIVTKKSTKEVLAMGITSIVGDFQITNYSSIIDLFARKGRVDFSKANNAFDYEIHVNFLYFEVDKVTGEVTKPNGKIIKNITPQLKEKFETSLYGGLEKIYSYTFFEDLAAKLTSNPKIVRYIGTPNYASCIEIEAWAAEESFVNFLMTNKPTNSFIQINTRYSNLVADDGAIAFGFISSRVKSPAMRLAITNASQDGIIYGDLTRHLGFRPWLEYKP
jgi:hypothetical protein